MFHYDLNLLDNVFICLVDTVLQWCELRPNKFIKHLMKHDLDHSQHEQASVKMFEFLVESNNLWKEFEKYGLQKQDLIFIKELIAGPLVEPKGKVLYGTEEFTKTYYCAEKLLHGFHTSHSRLQA